MEATRLDAPPAQHDAKGPGPLKAKQADCRTRPFQLPLRLQPPPGRRDLLPAAAEPQPVLGQQLLAGEDTWQSMLPVQQKHVATGRRSGCAPRAAVTARHRCLRPGHRRAAGS